VRKNLGNDRRTYRGIAGAACVEMVDRLWKVRAEKFSHDLGVSFFLWTAGPVL